MISTPSDALALLASTLFSLERGGSPKSEVLERWLSDATDALVEDALADNPIEEWTLDQHEVLELALEGIDVWPPTVPRTAAAFYAQVRGLQILDRWHRAITPNDNPYPLPKLKSHATAEDRLALKMYFGSCVDGIIVPNSAWGHIASDLESDTLGVAERPLLLRTLLTATAFLPRALSLGAAAGSAGRARKVGVRYVQDLGVDPVSSPSGLSKIGIAPLLEEEKDIQLWLNPSRKKYNVCAAYNRTRIKDVIDRSLKNGVELLVFPECAVGSADLDWVGQTILSCTRSYYRSTGEVPKLRYVVGGFSKCPDSSSRLGDNFVAMFDAMGRIIYQQKKLFRWDLNEKQIKKFGLNVDRRVKNKTLVENISIGREVIVVDLLNAGRFINLICADVDEELPGDWLLGHVRADWLNAPIFDQSTCWQFDTRGIKGPWITKRAYRASQVGGCKVIVSNSVAFTHTLNRVNKNISDPRVYAKCGIGLLVDPSTVPRQIKQIFVPMNGSSPVVSVELWNDHWTAP